MKRAALLAITLFAAPAKGQSTEPLDGYVLDPPPCSSGQDHCDPWDRYKPVTPNSFDKYVAKPLTGPAFLVIATPHAIRTIPYKTMAACERARRYAVGLPAGTRLPNGAILGPLMVTYACVPS